MCESDGEIVAYVEGSILDPKSFYKKHKKKFPDWETSFEVDPILVANAKLHETDYIGAVDWRASKDEIATEISRLSTRRSLDLTIDYDMFPYEDSCDITLKAIGAVLAQQSICLCVFSVPNDEYLFGLLTPNMYEQLKHISYPDFTVLQAIELR
jgi:hypothetical protein